MAPASATEDLDLGRWTATPEFVDEYLSTLEDKCPVYQEEKLAPPIALAARTLAILIEKLDLPPGTVHISQEIISQKAVAVGQEVRGVAKASRPFLRGKWRFLSVEFALHCGQEEVLRGKTTVMTPVKE